MTTADRLERTARCLREIPASERTETIMALLGMAIDCTMRASPEDAADFVEMIAKVMRG
jgi:hypothetical protein